MLWTDRIKKTMDVVTDIYLDYKTLKSRVVNDIKDVCRYAANCVNTMEYATGTSGTYANMNHNHNNKNNNNTKNNRKTDAGKHTYINNTNKTNNDVQRNNVRNNKMHNGIRDNQSDLIQGIRTIRNDLNHLESIVLDKDNFKSDKKSDNKTVNGEKKSDYIASDREALDEKVSNKNFYSANNPSPERLSKIIDVKNKYFWKSELQLQEIIKKETNINVTNIYSLMKEAMGLKVNDPKYTNIARINYDSAIASQEMKDDFIRAYSSSDKTLKTISAEFEKKYGMHISASTISRKARNYLSSIGMDFNNRREAKNYYAANDKP